MLYFLVYDDNTHNCYLEKLLQSVKIYGEEFNIIVLHLLTFQTPIIFLLIFLIFYLQFVEYYKLLLNV